MPHCFGWIRRRDCAWRVGPLRLVGRIRIRRMAARMARLDRHLVRVRVRVRVRDTVKVRARVRVRARARARARVRVRVRVRV